MNTLVVYFSGTGHTRTVAEEIASAVNGDIELIVEVGEKRAGVLGKIHSGVESLLKEKSKIEKPKNNPADYDLVFVGTPTWRESLTPPVDSYLPQMDLTPRQRSHSSAPNTKLAAIMSSRPCMS